MGAFAHAGTNITRAFIPARNITPGDEITGTA